MTRATFESVEKLFQLLNYKLEKAPNKTFRCDGHIFIDLSTAMQWLAKSKKPPVAVKPLSEKEILKAKQIKAQQDLTLYKIENCSDYFFNSRVRFYDKLEHDLDSSVYLIEGIIVRLEGLYPNYKVSSFQYRYTAFFENEKEYSYFENGALKPEHYEDIYKYLKNHGLCVDNEDVEAMEDAQTHFPDIAFYCEQAVLKAIQHQSISAYKFSCHNYLAQCGVRVSKVLTVKLHGGKAYVTYRLVNGKNGSTILSMRKCNPSLVKDTHISHVPVIDLYKMSLDRHYFAIAGWEVIKNGEKFCFISANTNGLGWLRLDERNMVLDVEAYMLTLDPDKVHPYAYKDCWYDAVFALEAGLIDMEKTIIKRNLAHDALFVVSAVANAYSQGKIYQSSKYPVEYTARKIFLSDVDYYVSGRGFANK